MKLWVDVPRDRQTAFNELLDRHRGWGQAGGVPGGAHHVTRCTPELRDALVGAGFEVEDMGDVS
jgi:hypothetical protein